MARVLVKVMAAVLALGALGGAAEAQQIDIRITASNGAYTPIGSGYDYREPGRYYGRPVPERGYWGGYGYGRPVAVQPHWGRRHDCRTIVKQKVTPWGQVVVKQKEVCR